MGSWPVRLARAVAAASLLFAAMPASVGATTPAYRVIDLGTLGGPNADVGNGPLLTRSGLIAGTADTDMPDPYGSADSGAFNGDPFVQHAYLWRNGVLNDLGALGPEAANNSSYPNGVNAMGDAAGLSDNGTIDPLVGGAEVDAVLWNKGHITNLGTLGGNQSQAFALNGQDQVVGAAANAVHDPFSMLGFGTEARAFLWQSGTMQDLGTLGGPDSLAWNINAAGQVAGVSYTNTTVNPVTGQPQTDVFLWKAGRMRDIGNLGGSVPVFGGIAGLNSRREIVGQSDLAGDQTAHPFLWNGSRLMDLGTLGGDNGSATGINAAGTVVGIAGLADGTHRGFVWTNGVMHDLPPLPGAQCSNALAINDAGDVVGNATDCHGNSLGAVLWRGAVPIDLNTLLAPSAPHLTDVSSFNDRGEIVSEVALPDGNQHEFLLIPIGG